jgi:CRP-like cAMP-binding protein
MATFSDNGDDLARALAGLSSALSVLRNPTSLTRESVGATLSELQKITAGWEESGGSAAATPATPDPEEPPAPMSKEERGELQRLFSEFDVDSSGSIDVGELRMLMSLNGVELTEAQVGDIMDQVDASGDREIDFDEFVTMMGPMLFKHRKEKAEAEAGSPLTPASRANRAKRRRSITLSGGIVVETDLNARPASPKSTPAPSDKETMVRNRSQRRIELAQATTCGKLTMAFAEAYRASELYIPPDSAHRIVWDMCMMGLIMYYAIATPVRIGFDIEPSEVTENILTVLFFFDIVLNFFTGVYDKGVEVKNKTLIAKDYVKFWFWVDLVASFPFDVITSGTKGAGGAVKVTKLFKIMRILKLLRLLKLGPILKRVKETLFGSSPNVLMVIKTISGLFFTWHWCACCYWFIVDYEWETEFKNRAAGAPGFNLWLPEAWLVDRELGQATIEDKYMHAFFWGVCVTTGIGWDVEPFTSLEVVFTTLMIIWGMLMYVTIIGFVTSIVSNMNSRHQERDKELSKFETYFRARLVPRHIQKKIKSYLDFIWSGDVTDQEDRRIMSTLPKELQMEVMLEVNRALVEQVPIFKDMPQEATFEVLSALKRMVFIPDETIITEGTSARTEEGSDLFLLSQGHARVTYEGKEVALLEKGSIFGEICFVGKANKRTATVVALTYCDTLKLARKDYEKILERNPMLRETMGKSIEVLSQRSLQARINLDSMLQNMALSMHSRKKELSASFKRIRSRRNVVAPKDTKDSEARGTEESGGSAGAGGAGACRAAMLQAAGGGVEESRGGASAGGGGAPAAAEEAEPVDADGADAVSSTRAAQDVSSVAKAEL